MRAPNAVSLPLPLALAACVLFPPACGDDGSVGSDTAASTGTTAAPDTTGSPPDATGTTDVSSGPTTGDGTVGLTGSTGAPTSTTTLDPTGDTGDTDDTGAAVPGAFCEPIPACNNTPPKLPGQGEPESDLSRGRDMFYVEGEAQWILGKFTKWGFPLDKDIEGELVHVFLDRDCAGAWEELGTTVTTVEGEHPTVQGVEDSGGRVYFEIPGDQQLGPGRHRVHLIVEEFWNTADLLIDVVPEGAPLFVSDVDGTLTTSENEEAWDFLLDTIPEANPYAPEALNLLASKGYRPMYITARPEWLDSRTRAFVNQHGFPEGIIHTTQTFTGGMGDSAATYKAGEFALLADKGLHPSWLFGNKDSDSTAFATTPVPPGQRIFFQFTDETNGGRRIESYQELLAEFELLPDLCDP